MSKIKAKISMLHRLRGKKSGAAYFYDKKFSLVKNFALVKILH